MWKLKRKKTETVTFIFDVFPANEGEPWKIRWNKILKKKLMNIVYRKVFSEDSFSIEIMM